MINIHGNIFNIQRYSLNDGSGIRTLVFMKGCLLKCKWCANPEGISPLTSLLFDASKCVQCGRCMQVCPQGAVKKEIAGISWDEQHCTACGACVNNCVFGARSLAGDTYSIDAVLHTIEKDQLFYNQSGGGVTVSGGEPLMQAEFVAELLRRCREDYGMHTAIETSAYMTWDRAKNVFDQTDQIHIDIKHMDSAMHKQLTHVPNELILENIQKIAETYVFSEKELIIRVPVIPQLNASDENIRATAHFVKKLGVVKRIDLLPYHNLGVHKYKKLNQTYELEQLGDGASSELMQHLQTIATQAGVPVKIGG